MSNFSFHSRLSDPRASLPGGYIGDRSEFSPLDRDVTLINGAGQAAQVTTIAIPASPDNSTAYSVVVDGITASYTSDGSATQAEVGAGLVAAINATPGVRGQMSASYAGGTLTLTGTFAGISHTVTASGGVSGGAIGSPSTSTSAASAATVPFGVAVVSTGVISGSERLTGTAPSTSTLTAQVQTFAITYASGGSYSLQVSINGQTYTTAPVAATTDDSATATAIAAAVNAVMPTETVIASTSTGSLIPTAEVEGAEFDAVAMVSGSASARATKAYTTGPSVSTSLARCFAGVTARVRSVEDGTFGGDDPSYRNGDAMTVHANGLIRVADRGLTINSGDPVYVSVASATRGYLYNAAGTDRVYLPPAVARWHSQISTDSIATVAINGVY